MIRLVVTGHDPAGKSVLASDQIVRPFMHDAIGGMQYHRLWERDSPAHYPNDGAPLVGSTYFPPVGGVRFGMIVMPPASEAVVVEIDFDALRVEIERDLPGILDYFDLDDPGMHTTATTDFEVILSGTCVLELDDGLEIELGAGDAVVQNGTRHRWHNRGDEPCQMAVFMIGAHHDSVHP